MQMHLNADFNTYSHTVISIYCGLD